MAVIDHSKPEGEQVYDWICAKLLTEDSTDVLALVVARKVHPLVERVVGKVAVVGWLAKRFVTEERIRDAIDKAMPELGRDLLRDGMEALGLLEPEYDGPRRGRLDDAAD